MDKTTLERGLEIQEELHTLEQMLDNMSTGTHLFCRREKAGLNEIPLPYELRDEITEKVRAYLLEKKKKLQEEFAGL